MSGKVRKVFTLTNILISTPIACLLLAAVISALEWDGTVSGRALALGWIGGALAVLALSVDQRQTSAKSTQVLLVPITQIRHGEYHRGYGDAAEDAFGHPDDPSLGINP